MADKRSQPPSGSKPTGGHGTFKHVNKGANLSAVLGAYKISQADFKRIRELVVRKDPAHAR